MEDAPDTDYILRCVKERLKQSPLEIKTLYGDVSSRKFFRVVLSNRSVVFMWYPEDMRHSMERDFTMITTFALNRLSPPLITRGDSWFIVEDGGERDLSSHMDTGSDERLFLLKNALGLIPGIQSLTYEVHGINPPLDTDLMRKELQHTEEWYIKAFLGKPCDQNLRRSLDDLAAEVGAFRRSFSHRDYHANNILVGPDRQLLLVDVQDARPAPRFYDLVSLMNERAVGSLDTSCRYDLIRYALEECLLVDVNSDMMKEIYLTSLQRTLKALGTFAKQICRGKETYRTFLCTGRFILEELLIFLDYRSLVSVLL